MEKFEKILIVEKIDDSKIKTSYGREHNNKLFRKVWNEINKS
jgi:hypothetical protein